MKYKATLYFSIILILLIPVNAFGDLDLVLLQEDLFGIRAPVNISVDLPVFTDADKIVIYGNVSTDTVLQVMIIDLDEKVILNKDVTIQAGDFTYDIVIGDYDLGRSGHYDISVSYNESEITEQFFYDSGHNVNPMKVASGIESLSESDQITMFGIIAIIIISVLIYLARHSIIKKKTEYDTGDWASKKNRDYEKYHSEWMSDEISFERKGKNKLSDEEFRKSLLKENLPDYYDILQVPKNANQDEIKRQFRLLAKKWHPDKKQSNDAEKKMAQINMAYEVLSNPKRRKMYEQYFSKN
jgi:molecular chaperone DnaJ